MKYLPNFLFGFILFFGIYFFVRNIKKLKRNIRLGVKTKTEGSIKQRWLNVLLIALGQKKMFNRPISAFLHFIVYIGFIVINIEVLEIIIDGIFGTHRIFSSLGRIYGVLIGTFEILALLVFISVIIFWLRRNMLRIKRFMSNEMIGWPKKDANVILYFEFLLIH